MSSKNLPNYWLIIFTLFFTFNISSSFAMGGPTETENQDLQKKLRIANENIRAKEASILMLKKEIDLTKNQLNEINDFLNKEKQTNKELSESLQKRDAEKITLQNTIAELNLNVSAYRTSLEDRESKLNQANQDINSLQDQLDELDKTKKESAEKIASFEDQIITLNKIKVGFESDIKTLKENLAKTESKLSEFSDYIPFKVVFSVPTEAKLNEPFDVLVEVKNKSDIVISSFKGLLELIDVNTDEVLKEIEIVNGSTKTSIMMSEPGSLSLGIRDPMSMLDSTMTKTINIQNIPANVPPSAIGNLQAYLSQYTCPQGQGQWQEQRVPVINFSAAEIKTGTGLKGTQIEGYTSNSYVGVDLETKDIIYITKIISGETVVGFNFSLYLCRSIQRPPHNIQDESGTLMNGPIPIIDGTRMPSVSGIWNFTITDPADCEMGSVNQGIIFLSIPRYQVPGTTSYIKSETRNFDFRGVNCIF